MTELVDYDLIFNELMKSVTRDPAVHEMLATNGPKLRMREFLTIGFKAGRQKGVTGWIAKFLTKNPKSILVVSCVDVQMDLRRARLLIPEPGVLFPPETHDRILTLAQVASKSAKVLNQLTEADYVITYDIVPAIDGAFSYMSFQSNLERTFSSDRVIVVINPR